MKTFFKKFVLFLCMVFFISSCSQSYVETGSISLSVDNILKGVERSGAGVGEYQIELNFSGDYSKIYTKVVKDSDLGTPNSIITIPNFPVNIVVDVALKITDSSNVVIYKGEKKKIPINPGDNKIVINVDSPVWTVLWSIYDFSGKFDGSVKPTFSFYDKFPDGQLVYAGYDKFLEDLCFDKYHNVYTIEKDVGTLEQYTPWTKNKVEVCSYSFDKNGERTVLYSSNSLSGPGSYDYRCITTDGEFLYLAKQTDGPKAGVDMIVISGAEHNPGDFITGISGNITSIEASGDFIYVGTTQNYQDECVITRYAKNDISVNTEKIIPEGYFAITDMQAYDNKLYILQRKTNGAEPNGIGGRLLPIDLGLFDSPNRIDASNSIGSDFFGDVAPKDFSSASSTPADFKFCGPVKFIAIKPKKLIIADDGQYGSYDPSVANSVKNSNAVVTVDISGSSPVVRSRTTVSNFNFDGAVNISSFKYK